MSSQIPRNTFAEATKVTPVSSHTYSANFGDDWCIGSVPHGGFITSVFLLVASSHFSTTLKSQNQPHTIALHLDFLRRTQTGPALFTVTDLKLGRQTSIIQITLRQNNVVEAICTLTQSNLHNESGVSYDTKWELLPKPLAVDLGKLKEGKDRNWETVNNMPFLEFRKATGNTEFSFPRGGQRKEASADEWVRLSTGEKWTNASLGYLSDTWPMPVESFLTSLATATKPRTAHFWYPTLLLNLDFKKALPEEGVEWLFVRVDTKVIKNGRMDIEVVILDEGGEVVALSNHVALAVGVERNTGGRKSKI